MKNKIYKISSKFMLTVLVTITFNFSTMAASSLSENNNQNSGNYNSGQLFDNSSSNNDMWGSSKSTAFENTTTPANAGGTRMNAPGDPVEPGESCVPVPDGTIVLLGFVFICGLVMMYRTKREKVKS